FYALLNKLTGRTDGRADVIAERVFRPAYQFNRVAGVLGFDWFIRKWVTLNAQYQLEYEQLRPSTGIALAELLATSAPLDRAALSGRNLLAPDGALRADLRLSRHPRQPAQRHLDCPAHPGAHPLDRRRADGRGGQPAAVDPHLHRQGLRDAQRLHPARAAGGAG